MTFISTMKPGEKQLMMGNEAFARGIIESGVSFASGYPGTPSSEIIETLAGCASQTKMYVEWSINEKVALETAAAASFANQRAVCVMKQNGVNVASDFLLHLSYSGVRGGLVLIACDDPGALSSVNEGESRHFAKMMEIPVLEPSNYQEAKDIVKTAFKLSEELKSIVMIRSMTRLSHASGIVEAGLVQKQNLKPFFHHAGFILDHEKGPVMSTPVEYRHQLMQKRIAKAAEFFETENLNKYYGPKDPELVIITSSADFLYSMEAVKILDLNNAGILKLVSTFPIPESTILSILKKTSAILFVEQVIPFLEEIIKNIYADNVWLNPNIKFYGKKSGHIPSSGETNTDIVINALCTILKKSQDKKLEEYRKKALEVSYSGIPSREMTFCPGCPHRASFFHINHAIKMDDNNGFVCGDIGCYSLGMLSCGYSTLKTIHSMGSGTGLASGFGKLQEQEMNQTTISVCGDSTFFHSGIPPLINAVHNNSNITMIILDNSGTAMTGFQPHPGENLLASGQKANPVKIEYICLSCTQDTYVMDPFDFEYCQKNIPKIVELPGVKVIILRHDCMKSPSQKNTPAYKVEINHEKCIGENCGCSNFCTNIFKCPALFLDTEKNKPKINQDICAGCGFCTNICFNNAIEKKEL